MPGTPPTAYEQSLIDDTEFLRELEQFNHMDEHAPDPARRAPMHADAFAALESGLRTNLTAPEARRPHHERPPLVESYDDDVMDAAEREAPQVSFVTAGFVLVACLTFGAMTAAIVFHDRVTQITAPQRPASR